MAGYRPAAGCYQAGRPLQACAALPGTVSGMWDRLSPEAREVMSLALTESEQLGHGYLGDEHVLLGLLRGAGQPGVVPAAGARPGSCQRPRRAAAAFRGRA